jgi:uncharacterized membrane protein
MQRVHRFLRNRPRLITAFATGFLAAWLLPEEWGLVTRALLGWNAAVWSYLLLMGWLMARASVGKVREIAEQEDEGAVAVLAIISIAATLSLAAIIFELTTVRNAPAVVRLWHYAFTASTVFGSWCLVAVVFTFHYARSYYRQPPGRRGLRFPDDDTAQPDYWDFLYFAFTLAVAAQTSDVTVMNREMRKTVLAQSVLSFIFNAAILGLSINIAAGAVGI